MKLNEFKISPGRY